MVTLIARAWPVVRSFLPDLRDVHVYGGGLLVVIGAAAVWPPLAYITGGGLLLYLGLTK